jgi:FkbM family methyltransferase
MSAGPLLLSPRFAESLAEDPIVLVDVGARGDAEEPWRSLRGGPLRVVGFEPDEAECERLNSASRPGEHYIPAALWSEPGRVPVHVAEFPGCSSVHPPDMDFLSAYAEPHWKPRRTTARVEFDATTLDAVAAEHGLDVDFLKIDTQGSEWEILSGAEQVLRGQVFGAVVETWTAPVHEGQRLAGEVMTLMAKRGFGLFDLNVAAAWGRSATDGDDLGGKRQLMGLDLLFLRQPARWEGERDAQKRLKGAAIAEAYGFPDYALELLDGPGQDWARETLLASAHERLRRRRSLRGRIESLTGRGSDDFASLHS